MKHKIPRKNKFFYLAPFLIACIYLLIYFVVFPQLYGTVISVHEWLFGNPESIIQVLKDSQEELQAFYLGYVFKIINWLLAAMFLFSLFLVGYTIQHKKPPIRAEAVLTEKEAYRRVLVLLEEMKLLPNMDVQDGEKALKLVCERLRNESGFGYGDKEVICCENDIASYIQQLESKVLVLKNNPAQSSANQEIVRFCQMIQAKLNLRIELKKR